MQPVTRAGGTEEELSVEIVKIGVVCWFAENFSTGDEARGGISEVGTAESRSNRRTRPRIPRDRHNVRLQPPACREVHVIQPASRIRHLSRNGGNYECAITGVTERALGPLIQYGRASGERAGGGLSGFSIESENKLQEPLPHTLLSSLPAQNSTLH